MNVLAVGAHFDDVELGCSGTLIKHVNQGNRVIIMVVTNSQFEDKDGCVVRAKETALAEGTKSAELIGAELICLDYDTLYVPFDEGLTKQIIKTIEENDIDIVVSACPACAMNLQHSSRKLKDERNVKIKVMDITEVVARAI